MPARNKNDLPQVGKAHNAVFWIQIGGGDLLIIMVLVRFLIWQAVDIKKGEAPILEY